MNNTVSISPLVTIIVPVYNVRLYLREALDSVINQTYRNLEIIVVDDGSTDGSGMICDEYRCDSRVRVIHQANLGLSAARNTGLSLMTGEYVAFLDSDDAFCPEMIQRMVKTITEENTDIAICGYSHYKTKGSLASCQSVFSHSYEYEILSSKEALKRMIDGRIDLTAWSKVYSRYLWEEIRFPNGRVYEDLSTAYLIFNKANTIVTLPQIMVYHRVRMDSITKTRLLKYVQDKEMANAEWLAFIVKNSPYIFDKYDLLRMQQRRLKESIENYCRIPLYDQKHAKALRIQIINSPKEYRTEWPLYIKVLFRMIQLSPSIIPGLLSTYILCKEAIHSMETFYMKYRHV